MKMKALTFLEPGKVKLIDVEMPEPGKDELLIKVLRVGVCGLDLSILLTGGGLKKAPVGHISGNEFLGVRKDTGEKVLVNPLTHCGICRPCRSDRTNVCQHPDVIGRSAMKGSFAEYVVVPKNRIVPVSDISLADEKLTLTEPLATGLMQLILLPQLMEQ